MAERVSNLVVIGASAGGAEALAALAADLPRELDAAVCVVLHLSPDAESHLAHLVSRVSELPATQVRKREKLLAGHIYVAPPDHHIVVADGHVAAVEGPRVNEFRPSIDVLFNSAAVAFRERTVAVVLSGTRNDSV